ncbi:MAG: ABC transporter ATP-binding protein [Planctomycetota bacterium]|nr:ABC transporter ATP-binding protein [Planctomycetota bacterium]
MALLSAVNLGVGLLGLVPVLGNILGSDPKTLAQLAADAAAKVPVLFPRGLPGPLLDQLPTDRFKTVLIMVLGLGALTVVGALANFMHVYCSLTLTTRTIADIRRAAFIRLVHLPLGVAVSGKGADFTSRVLHDTTVLSRGLQALTSKAVGQATRGVAALSTAFIVNWRLSLITLLVAPLLALIIRKLGKRIRRASRGAMKSQAKLLEDAGEVLRGFRVVKVFTGERAEVGRFSAHNRQVLGETLRMRTAQAIASPLLETITIFVLGGLALIAAKAIIENELPATEFLVALGSLALAGASLKPLTTVLQDMQVAEAAATRLRELLTARVEEPRDRRLPRLPRHARSVEFQSVTFAYAPQDQPAILDISLTIPFGQTVAFVGPNGCGKTTLLSLLPLLYTPASGRILIDGADITTVRLRSLRRQMGVVTQEPFLFRGTIASNIAYGSPDATPQQIEQAARRAHALDFIDRLPKGLLTDVGDAGLTLSGGQRQRIAIARALLRDPAILIMDEATSMIDSESEAQIATAVQEMSGSRTVLIVAHRLTTVMSAQRIVVMDRGRVVDVGAHAQLLDRCPLYRDLTRRQLAPAGV